MNYRAHAELTSRLAAEYVLGTLRHRARRRFETWMAEEPTVQRQVDFWQRKLSPMLHATTPVQPPPRVWQAIEQRVQGRPQGTQAGWWRWLGVAGLACSLMLAVWVVHLQQQAVVPAYIAVLNNSEQQPGYVVALDARGHELQLSALRPTALNASQDLELWVIPPTGAPVSLGVLARNGPARVPLLPAQERLLQQAQALAISLEPRGGSPTGAPTGPVLWSGGIARGA